MFTVNYHVVLTSAISDLDTMILKIQDTYRKPGRLFSSNIFSFILGLKLGTTLMKK